MIVLLAGWLYDMCVIGVYYIENPFVACKSIRTLDTVFPSTLGVISTNIVFIVFC